VEAANRVRDSRPSIIATEPAVRRRFETKQGISVGIVFALSEQNNLRQQICSPDTDRTQAQTEKLSTSQRRLQRL
jgi:hypothetical protein